MKKMNRRFICFAIATVALLITLFFTSCGSTTAKAEGTSKPCYHVSVYSPAIECFGNATWRDPKYTITVDSFSELLPDPDMTAKMEYDLLRIPLGDGRFELVSTSLVEIEYY